MTRHYKRFIFIALVIVLSGCTAQRRYHQGGIHIDWHSFGHQESSDKNHQDKSVRKSDQKAAQQADQKAAQQAENHLLEQPTTVVQNPHPSNIENGPLKSRVVTRNEIKTSSIISIEDQTTQFANFTNVQNAKAPLSASSIVAASGSNKNPRQNKGHIRANDGDPDQLKNLETAAIVIYAIGLLVGILALIFWSNTLAIITAAIMSIGFVVFLCCGGKAHYFFSWVMSFLIGLGLIVLMIKKGDGNFHGFFIP
jgi:ribosomal protein S11